VAADGWRRRRLASIGAAARNESSNGAYGVGALAAAAAALGIGARGAYRQRRSQRGLIGSAAYRSALGLVILAGVAAHHRRSASLIGVSSA